MKKPRILRIRARRRASSYYPSSPKRIRQLAGRLAGRIPAALIILRFGATLAVVVHLFAAALLPGGRNALFDWSAPAPFTYLGLAGVGDMHGFYKTAGVDSFLLYRIHTEKGGKVESTFPDASITPRLRYDRWAVLSHNVGRDDAELQALFMNYLVNRMESPPIKVELYSARWREGGGGEESKSGGNNGMHLELRELGAYHGLPREWLQAGKKRKQ